MLKTDIEGWHMVKQKYLYQDVMTIHVWGDEALYNSSNRAGGAKCSHYRSIFKADIQSQAYLIQKAKWFLIFSFALESLILSIMAPLMYKCLMHKNYTLICWINICQFQNSLYLIISYLVSISFATHMCVCIVVNI